MREDYKKILNELYKSESGEITTKQAVKLIGGRYYSNASNYVGLKLSAMVKAKLLIRVKHGIYKAGTGVNRKAADPDPLQIALFS